MSLNAVREDEAIPESMLDLVIDAIGATLEEAGRPRPALRADTNILHDTDLDSMGLAIVVVRLEELTGKDPFADGFINFTTVGELAALYAR
jgi:acyl carrier protein